MGYGSRGRYWNVGLSDPGRLAATKNQLWTLHRLSGRKEDYRGKGLTRDQASELIRKKLEELEEGKNLTGDAMRDAMFQAIWKKAARAANEAGSAWLAEHPVPIFSVYDPEEGQQTPVHGAIGHVYISWPPRKSPFAKWLKRTQGDGQYVSVDVPHMYVGRLERDLMIACEAAALRVLETNGLTGMKLMLREDPSTRLAA